MRWISVAGLALIAASAGLSATCVSAAGLPVGTWNCVQGPSWSEAAPAEFRQGPTLTQVWVLDARHYATSDRRDRGVFALKGDEVVPVGGPFTRVPMSAHFKPDGPGGAPTLFLHWSTAPKLFLVCQREH
jgi:hypothetical protein